jgi:hypothetical protein
MNLIQIYNRQQLNAGNSGQFIRFSRFVNGFLLIRAKSIAAIN